MVTLVMLNMLIAKLGDTYERIAEQSEQEWMLERARMLKSIENEMTPLQYKSVQSKYLVKVWHLEKMTVDKQRLQTQLMFAKKHIVGCLQSAAGTWATCRTKPLDKQKRVSFDFISTGGIQGGPPWDPW